MITASSLIAKFRQALQEDWGYIWGTAGVRWTDARHKALLKTTTANRESSRKYGAKWIGHTVADCSGLFAWAFKSLGGYMYHGSNTMYLKYCAAKGRLQKGQRTDGLPVKPGTAVFCWHDGVYTHVGLFVGDNTVIEASSPQAGVITSKLSNKKWVAWGEMKGVNYDTPGAAPAASEAAPSAPAAPTPPRPILRFGYRGDAVAEMQALLIARGFSCGPQAADGIFGWNTRGAVKNFQKARNLKADGVCGPETWAQLTKEA